MISSHKHLCYSDAAGLNKEVECCVLDRPYYSAFDSYQYFLQIFAGLIDAVEKEVAAEVEPDVDDDSKGGGGGDGGGGDDDPGGAQVGGGVSVQEVVQADQL